MKLHLSKLLIALMVLIVSVAAPAQAAKKVVAILDFDNISGYSAQNIAKIMNEQMINVVHNSGQYTVLERSQMAKILREHGFQNVAADPSQAVQMGKLAGAQYSILGTITEANVNANVGGNFANKIVGLNVANNYKGNVAISFRIVNNETGEIREAKIAKGAKTGGNIDQALYNACEDAAEEILDALNGINVFSARVADVSGENIYIDAGSESGIRKGEVLVIRREGAPIVINGKMVGVKETDIGRAKVTEVNAEYSVCRVTAHTSNIKQGDVVKRVSKEK